MSSDEQAAPSECQEEVKEHETIKRDEVEKLEEVVADESEVKAGIAQSVSEIGDETKALMLEYLAATLEASVAREEERKAAAAFEKASAIRVAAKSVTDTSMDKFLVAKTLAAAALFWQRQRKPGPQERLKLIFHLAAFLARGLNEPDRRCLLPFLTGDLPTSQAELIRQVLIITRVVRWSLWATGWAALTVVGIADATEVAATEAATAAAKRSESAEARAKRAMKRLEATKQQYGM